MDQKEKPIEERIMVILDDKSESNERELIWVPSDWKGIIEKMTGAEAVRKEVVHSIAQFKKDIEIDIEYSGELISTLKTKYEAQREELKKFYEAEGEMSYQLWEELDKKRAEIHGMIRQAREELKNGLQKELTSLKEQINNLNLYGFDKLLEAIQKFNSMSDKDKELLAIAFKGYRREDT